MTAGGQRVRVFVADDHPLYRDGVVRAIRDWPEFELVGEAADGRAALTALEELKPDVAVLDLRMPELGGVEILEALVRDGVPTRVVLLSAFTESAVAYDAVAAGAAAFLTKDAGRQTICETIAAVARGERVFAPEINAALAEAVRERRVDDQPALSGREREILVLIAEGLSGPEVAERLFLSPTTVKSHLQNLYRKLGVSDRAAAVAEAMRRGLLE